MSLRIGLVTALLAALLSGNVAFGGKWDVALDGGWMRCVIDFDSEPGTVAAMVYQAAPGGNLIKIDDVAVITRGENYLLQGIVTYGTFKVGLGNMQFTVGDRFYLWISRYTDKNMLVLVNQKTYWHTALTWF